MYLPVSEPHFQDPFMHCSLCPALIPGTGKGNKGKTEPVPWAAGSHPQNSTTKPSGTYAVGRTRGRYGLSADLLYTLATNTGKSREVAKRILNRGTHVLTLASTAGVLEPS